MTKRIWSGWLLAALLTSAGCRMCCPSYDYCGPTEPGESNSECCGMVRRGSILSGETTYAEGAILSEGETYYEDGAVIEEVPDETPLITPPAPPKLETNPSARRTR